MLIEDMSQSEMRMTIFNVKFQNEIDEKQRSKGMLMWHVLDSIRHFVLFKNSISSNEYLFIQDCFFVRSANLSFFGK